MALLTLLSQTNMIFYDIPPCKYHLHSGACTHCNWTNIEFDHWTRYSIECAMCHRLTTLTNLFLLLNVCLWLST